MSNELVRVGTVEEVRSAVCTVVQMGGTPVVVLHHEGAFHALDNRCPHMGFPLHRGDIHDGLLDCHWHHARFDISCGATLDPWADDVACYRVEVRDGEVFVDPEFPPRDPRSHGLARLDRGLKDSIRLIIAKSVMEMLDAGLPPADLIAPGAAWGATQRDDGWAPGLSILAAMANVLPALDPVDRQRAMTQSLARIATDCQGHAPRRPLPPLEGSRRDAAGLRSWFRETIEVRDSDGAERILRTIVEEHGTTAALDAVLAAATDHRYSDVGHSLDFAMKCAELVDHLGPDAPADLPAQLFTSLVPGFVKLERMEETSSWRRPVDVAMLVADAIPEVPEEAFSDGAAARWRPLAAPEEEALVETLLGEVPAEALATVVRHVTEGVSPVDLAEAVVLAATRRVMQFGKANETPDWDTVHHTQSYANAVAEGMRRCPSHDLFRAVLDGAVSCYLDRFLNLPPAPMPQADGGTRGDAALGALIALYDTRASIDEVAGLAWSFLRNDGPPERLLAALGHVVLREDSGFHEFQQIDIARRRLQRRPGHASADLALTATARWLASQYPTRRGREQTFDIARRLHRGDPLHEDT